MAKNLHDADKRPKPNFLRTPQKEVGSEGAPFSLAKDRKAEIIADSKEPIENRERAAAHELAHHLYAQEIGLESKGIKLGNEINKPGVKGRTLFMDMLNAKMHAGTATNEDAYKTVDGILADGFGEEAALGTPVHEWSDRGDFDLATMVLKDRGMSDSQIETFINNGREKASNFFSRSEVKAKIQRGYKPLAQNHWSSKASPAQIKKYTEGG